MCASLATLSPCGPRVITEAAAADRGGGGPALHDGQVSASPCANAGDSQERIPGGGLCLSQGICFLLPSLLLLPAPLSSSLPPVLPCLLPAPKQSPQDVGSVSGPGRTF